MKDPNSANQLNFSSQISCSLSLRVGAEDTTAGTGKIEIELQRRDWVHLTLAASKLHLSRQPFAWAPPPVNGVTPEHDSPRPKNRAWGRWGESPSGIACLSLWRELCQMALMTTLSFRCLKLEMNPTSKCSTSMPSWNREEPEIELQVSTQICHCF